ncbi:MAG: thiamine diphosphokinase [Chloroflexota bacterium]
MKRVVIIANGVLNDPDAARALLDDARGLSADLVIAVDGGSLHARTLGVVPHLVVGDLDSLPPEEHARLSALGVRFIIHPAQKDQTDLELALEVAAQEQPDEIIVLAAMGGRWDQTLANCLLLALPTMRYLPVRLVEGAQEIRLVHGEAILQGQPGDTLSLIPVLGDAHGVTLEGLFYPLHEGTLGFGSTLGISNVFTAPQARIRVRDGLLLAVHIRNTNIKEE